MTSKWICIKNRRQLIKEGDIVEGGFMQIGIDNPEDKIFYYVFEGDKFFQKSHWKYFRPLAEWREQQIKSVLDE